jgi:hypothetical protein
MTRERAQEIHRFSHLADLSGLLIFIPPALVDLVR